MTTTEVKKQIIEASTKHRKSSFCDMLKASEHPAYGARANVFVSHAHQCQFWNTIQAVRGCLSKDDSTENYDDVVVWMDLFSINQHEPKVWTTDWLCNTFRSSIEQIGRTIMVMSPWDHPTPFTRTWCIFEAYSTMDTGGRFDIAMGEDDEKQFLNDILAAQDDDSSLSKINLLLSNIQAESSQCTSPVDKRRIFEVIRETIGFEEIDRAVLRQYTKWVVAIVIEFGRKAMQEGTYYGTDKARLERVIGALSYGRWLRVKESLFATNGLRRVTQGMTIRTCPRTRANKVETILDCWEPVRGVPKWWTSSYVFEGGHWEAQRDVLTNNGPFCVAPGRSPPTLLINFDRPITIRGVCFWARNGPRLVYCFKQQVGLDSTPLETGSENNMLHIPRAPFKQEFFWKNEWIDMPTILPEPITVNVGESFGIRILASQERGWVGINNLLFFE